MLTKLLKHEFAATARFMWIIYAAMAALSVFANISMRLLDKPEIPGLLHALMILILVVWVISLIAAMVATLVLMLKRFHKNLLTDEGYLMFTLPTDTHRLVIAKLLTAVVWQLATMAVIALCVGLAVMSTSFLREIAEFLRGMFRELTVYYAANGALIILEVLLMLFFGCASSLLEFYSSMSIGHGFANHKGLWSVVFYFAQSTALQTLSTVGIFLLSQSPIWQSDFMTFDGVQAWHMSVLSVCVAELLICGIFYCLTTWNLKHRLNLS